MPQDTPTPTPSDKKLAAALALLAEAGAVRHSARLAMVLRILKTNPRSVRVVFGTATEKAVAQ